MKPGGAALAAGVLLALLPLVAAACGEDPTPPPEPPPEPAPAAPSPVTPPPALPAPEESAAPNAPNAPNAPDAPDAPNAPNAPNAPDAASPAAAEPKAWGDLDETLRDPPDERAEAIRKELSSTRIHVDFDKAPLDRVVSFLSEQTGVRIRLDERTWEAHTREELSISCEAGSTTLESVLDGISATRPVLRWWIEGDTVRISPAPRPAPMVETLVPLGTLTRWTKDPATGEVHGHRGEEIADMVRDKVDFATWAEGGEVRFLDDRNALAVKAPKATQRKVLALLRSLR